MDWKFIIDTAVATLCASLISISGMLIVNWFSNRKGYKDIDAKIGKLDNTTLSGQHKSMEETILKDLEVKQADLDYKIGNLTDTTLSGQNKAILQQVQSIKNDMTAAQKEDYIKRQQLTGNQAKIEQSITALSAFSQVMVELQNRNASLEHENKLLQQENLQLKQEVSELNEQMEQDQEPEESMDLH